MEQSDLNWTQHNSKFSGVISNRLCSKNNFNFFLLLHSKEKVYHFSLKKMRGIFDKEGVCSFFLPKKFHCQNECSRFAVEDNRTIFHWAAPHATDWCTCRFRYLQVAIGAAFHHVWTESAQCETIDCNLPKGINLIQLVILLSFFLVPN